MIAIPAALSIFKNKYVLAAIGGAALLFLIWFAITSYGDTREQAGYDRRDTAAKLELAARQTALYKEQVKLDKATFEAGVENERIRQESAKEKGMLRDERDGALSDIARLRGQLAAARAGNQHSGSATGNASFDRDSARLVVIEECIREYSALAGNASNWLDDLAGWRGHWKAIAPR